MIVGDRRVYSMNLIAYIKAKKPNISYTKYLDDLSNHVYVIFDEDIEDLVKEYRNDEDMQRFIIHFADIKNDMLGFKYAKEQERKNKFR